MHNRTTKCRRNHQSHDNITENNKKNNLTTTAHIHILMEKNRIPKEKL